MRLSRLELAGFKSFATSTTVEFHDGMTALVGPNGCGKSNVVEAIRWVLGEQKPTHIRGRKMQEVIFHGSRNRRPAARAQVAVTIDNSDGILPVAHSEVEIGRSIDREGKTRYTINRAVCRLRDVVDLCRDTGLGVGSYSAIEGRMLNAIISARGDERRALFEEAAGIGRYKDRRAVTERRLDAVAADLQRLDDLGVEIRKNVRRLSREKGRAERYLKQRSRLRALDVTLAERRLDDLRDQLAKVAAAGRDAAGDDGPDAVSFVRAEADHLALRKEVDLCRDARAKVAERQGEAASGLARCERELAVADERSVQAEARISRSEELRNAELARQKELDDELAVTRTGIEGVEADLRLVRRRTGKAANQAEELRAGMAAARRAVETLAAALRENARLSAGLGGEIEAGEERLLAGRQRLDALVRERSESLPPATEGEGDLEAELAAAASAEADAEAALAAARAASVSATTRFDDARRRERAHTERLETGELRHAALARLERDREGFEPVVRAVLSLGDESVIGPLSDFITGDDEGMELVEAHLGELARAVVVSDAAAALRLGEWFAREWKGGGGLTLLPLDAEELVGEGKRNGDLARRIVADGQGAAWVRTLLDGAAVVHVGEFEATLQGGVYRVGYPAGAAGLLERRRELRRLGTELAELRTRVDDAREIVRKRKLEAEAQAEAVREGQAVFDTAGAKLRRMEDEVAALSLGKERARRVAEEIALQIERVESERSEVSERLESARSRLVVLTAEEAELTRKLAVEQAGLDEVRTAWEKVRSRVTEITVEGARLDGELARLQERATAITTEHDRVEATLRRLARELDADRRRLQEGEKVMKEGRARLQELFDAGDRLAAELAAADDELEELKRRLGKSEGNLREARRLERDRKERSHRLELERRELQGSVKLIEERVRAEWGRSPDELLAVVETVEGANEELAQERDRLSRLLTRHGPVNVLAVEEHAEARERLSFLDSQHDDLTAARADLQEAIRDIDQTAEKRFGETFTAVQESFASVFDKLFPGGEAELRMGDSPESPIEIHASPRGKRFRRIELLSGGERALTALALLFSLYLVKPSPFCLMDEVDATLDEHNIGRFLRLLDEFKDRTQFIVITHNPRTVASADWLYGVTMEEAGTSTLVTMRSDGEPLSEDRGSGSEKPAA